ncbi:MAG: transglutaminase-like domain-containing protein [Ruminococcus sp.]|nr:transglutaminase-like domain-containing protein [Ruminococcus sp.]
MSLIWTIKRIKHRKLKTLNGYLDFIRNQDLSKVPPLSIEDSKVCEEPDYDNMFTYLDEYDELKRKYKLDEVVCGSTDFDKALSLMNWLTKHTYYSGQQCLFHKPLPDDTLSILNFSFDKPFEYAINCRYKAIALTDLLIAYGIKAYPLAMIDSKIDGNHLTVHAHLEDQNKWVLLDPSFNTYFVDAADKLLDAIELRNRFLSGDDIIIKGYNFNGTTECIEIYKELFVKSTLTNLSTWKDNSLTGRKSKNFKNRKEFECKIPIM